MLSPITSEPKERDFAVYDLEWIPGTYELRLAGLYDGERYQAFKTVDALLIAMLQPRHRGRWYFAHFGGMADATFLLEVLADPTWGFKVEASFSGASAIIIKISKGIGKSRYCWYLCDSFWLLKDKLRNIAKSLGLEKGNADESEEFYAKAPWGELRDYNEQDCVILWRAIKRFQDELLMMGGELQKTIAGTAMNLFRRKYLDTDITTSDVDSARVQPAYIASRVEVIEKRLERGFMFDINSSFPHSMTYATPGSMLGLSRRLPDKGLYAADLTITVPDMHLPPLPYRHKDKILFPTGTWRSWFTTPDVELLQEYGGRIEKVHLVSTYEERFDMGAYAKDLYELRRKETDDFRRMLLKYLLNSLYGKTAEEPEKTKLILHPERLSCPHGGKHENDECIEELFPGAVLVTNDEKIAHRHVIMAATITARSRALLYRYMRPCSRVAYCDTDSIATPDELPTTDGLGGLKKEREFISADFLRQKLYGLKLADGTEVVKSKGFRKMPFADLMRLYEGAELEQTRMMRIRECLRSGKGIGPRDVRVPKRLRPDTMPKRKYHSDGTSEPWDVAEFLAKQ